MICLPVMTMSSFKRRKKYHLLTCFDGVKFQEEKETSSAYLFWRCQDSREERKDHLLTWFDDVKFKEEKERWSAYLFWRCQVPRGKIKVICLPVLTISSFKKRKKDHLLTCLDDIKFQEEKERWPAYLFWRYLRFRTATAVSLDQSRMTHRWW